MRLRVCPLNRDRHRRISIPGQGTCVGLINTEHSVLPFFEDLNKTISYQPLDLALTTRATLSALPANSLARKQFRIFRWERCTSFVAVRELRPEVVVVPRFYCTTNANVVDAQRTFSGFAVHEKSWKPGFFMVGFPFDC